MAYLKLGTLNILPFLESGGIKWGLTDVVGKSVTTLDGTKHEDIQASKRTLDLTFPDLADTYVRQILTILRPKLVSVTTDLDPIAGIITYEMHCDGPSAEVSFIYDNGVVKWSGLQFELVEY